jgi:hypothetical protein
VKVVGSRRNGGTPWNRILWIKWIGTHKDYDKIDVKKVQHDG